MEIGRLLLSNTLFSRLPREIFASQKLIFNTIHRRLKTFNNIPTSITIYRKISWKLIYFHRTPIILIAARNCPQTTSETTLRPSFPELRNPPTRTSAPITKTSSRRISSFTNNSTESIAIAYNSKKRPSLHLTPAKGVRNGMPGNFRGVPLVSA